MTIDGEGVVAECIAVGVEHMGGRSHALVLRLDNDAFAKTGSFVFLHTEGDTFGDVLELDGTGMVGNDDGVERIPVGDNRAFLHVLAFFHEET